jgi:hypothetical protein
LVKLGFLQLGSARRDDADHFAFFSLTVAHQKESGVRTHAQKQDGARGCMSMINGTAVMLGWIQGSTLNVASG